MNLADTTELTEHADFSIEPLESIVAPIIVICISHGDHWHCYVPN